MKFLDVFTILASSIMIGVELAVSLFTNPAIWKRDDQGLASDLAKTLGRVMPFWYGVGLLLLSAEAVLRRHDTGRNAFASAAVIWALTIVYTIVLLVPINKLIAQNGGGAGYDWKAQHKKWDLLHRWRIGFLLSSVLIFLWGLL